MICPQMSEFLAEFKRHACEFDENIKELERSYANPSGFFGTSIRHKTAYIILNRQLEHMRIMKDEIKKFSIEFEESKNAYKHLLEENDQLSCDTSQVTKTLEEFGFCFSFGKRDSSTDEEEREISGDTSSHMIKKAMCNSFSNESLSGDELACTEIGPTECVEKYLEDNNMELDDLVTPYIPRRTLNLSKRSK